MSDDNQTVGQTLRDDAHAATDDVKKAGEWVEDKAVDAKNAVENDAEAVGLNHGDPNRNDD